MKIKHDKLNTEEERIKEAFEKHNFKYVKKEDFYVDGIVILSKKGNISMGNA
jgi:hypothetical protein